MKIGAHVSVAGGLANGIANAKRIGANTIQIFGSSPRQWRVRLPDPRAAEEFRRVAKAEGIGPVFLHAPYLANLANPSPENRLKSREALIAHFQIAEMTGSAGLIFHIGSGAELPKKEAFRAVVGEMKEILKAVPGEAHLVMENSAGGGAKIGGTPEEIAELAEAVRSPRVSVCFDTAHAFEAGLVPDYSPKTVADLARRIGRTIGWQRMAAIHANDSKTKWNSHHDQHENIGEGHIGLAGFRSLLAEPHFRKLPWLLEVPGSEGMPDKRNVDILKKLASLGHGRR